MLALLLVGVVLVIGHGTDAGLGAAGRVWIFFAIGALARHHVPRSAFKPAVALPLLALWSVAGLLVPASASALSWASVPYLTLALGLSASAPGLAFRRLGDLSYGTYLWGFPVQQVVIERFGNLPLAVDIPVVVACTLGLAWLSWHNLEARALRLKPRGDETEARSTRHPRGGSDPFRA